MIPVWRGKTRHGKLTLADKLGFIKYLESIEHGRDGQDIEIVARIPDETRSLRQNDFFHAIVLPEIADAAGHLPEDMKEILKSHFGVSRTSLLSKQEFALFLDNCIRLAAEMYDIVIPDPMKVDF